VAGESDYERAERLTAELLVKDARIVGLIAEVENLHRAMESRAVIEQAKGVIMHATGCGPDVAFATLVAQSQAENRKLAEVALELTAVQGHPPPESG
jgi:AmiR/NasT family two-component response regulator